MDIFVNIVSFAILPAILQVTPSKVEKCFHVDGKASGFENTEVTISPCSRPFRFIVPVDQTVTL